MNGRCENCEWWKRLAYVERGHYDPREEGDWGTCYLIGHGEEHAEASNRDDRKDATSQRAFTVDGSDYWSALNTRADFGCADFAPSTSKDTEHE